MIKDHELLADITAVWKEMFIFRSQLRMVKSCFCLCLKSTLDFPTSCFPFCIWLFACCLCSLDICRCAQVASLSRRFVEPLLLCSVHGHSSPWQSAADAGLQQPPAARWLKPGPLPRAGGAGSTETQQQKYWQHAGLCPLLPQGPSHCSQGVSAAWVSGWQWEGVFHPQERILRGF